MRHKMKPTSTSAYTWVGIGLASLGLVTSLSACGTKPAASVIIPDSREIREAVTCNEAGDCTFDPGRVTIDLGYLRDIMDTLDMCRKGQI